MAPDPKSPFELIVGVHDLAESPDAVGDEMLSWLPMSTARPLLDEILANSRKTDLPLTITSDDAFRSDYDMLLPWLLENSLIGTFFIPTRFVGRPGRLTETQMREMAKLGMRFGVHGASHINWLTATPDIFAADVAEGKDALEQMLGAKVDTAAAPFGGFDGRIAAHLRSRGLTTLYTSRSGLALRKARIKPRNMLKSTQIEPVRAISRQRGTFRDAARSHIRTLRADLQALVSRG